MKRLLLLSTICFLSITNIFSQPTSILNMRMFNNREFNFTLDGANYPSAYIQRIENLRPGNHFLSVYAIQYKHHGYVNKLIYRGTLFIEPATETFISLCQGSLQVTNVVNLFPITPQFNSHQFTQHASYNNLGQCGTATSCYSPQPMTDFEFSNFLRSLNNAGFESTKLSIAYTVLNNNYFTTYQVKQVLEQFSFESTKLDFAKSAYSKTIDRNNYYSISDMFSFSSSTHALNNYIASR